MKARNKQQVIKIVKKGEQLSIAFDQTENVALAVHLKDSEKEQMLSHCKTWAELLLTKIINNKGGVELSEFSGLLMLLCLVSFLEEKTKLIQEEDDFSYLLED